jgi:outer membrane protein assembly factor BamB
LVFLLSCTAKDASLIPADLAQFKSSATVNSRWQAALDGNARTSGIGPFKSGRVYSRPIFGDGGYRRFYMAIEGDILYAMTKKGNVFAVNKNNGSILWRAHLSDNIGGGLSLNENVLFAGTLDGYVLALSTADGSVLWKTKVSTEIISPPKSNGKQVLVTAIDGRLVALNAATGEQLWNYDHPQPLLTFRAQASPLLFDDQAFVAFDNGQLLSFGTREGDLRWSVRVSQPQGITELERAVDLDATPISRGPFILSAGANGRIVAVSRGSGKISWAEDASVYNDIVANDDAVFYADEASHLFARRLASGQVLWQNKEFHRRNLGPPALLGSYLLAIDGSNFLHVLDSTTGQIAARTALLGNGYGSPMIVDNGIAYVLSDNGSLSAYEVTPKETAN